MAMPQDPLARKYYRVAKQRFAEATTILRKAQLPAAAHYLGGYAVECILKALVVSMTPRNKRGTDVEVNERMKQYGHGLEVLRREVIRHGARMPQRVAGEFVFVQTWDPQSRYEPGPGDPDEVERFLSAASTIIQWADERMS